jgi:hypothetical protein
MVVLLLLAAGCATTEPGPNGPVARNPRPITKGSTGLLLDGESPERSAELGQLHSRHIRMPSPNFSKERLDDL